MIIIWNMVILKKFIKVQTPIQTCRSDCTLCVWSPVRRLGWIKYIEQSIMVYMRNDAHIMLYESIWMHARRLFSQDKSLIRV